MRPSVEGKPDCMRSCSLHCVSVISISSSVPNSSVKMCTLFSVSISSARVLGASVPVRSCDGDCITAGVWPLDILGGCLVPLAKF